MKRVTVVWVSLLCICSAEAALFVDRFDRLDTGFQSDGSLIGANWVNSRSSGFWGITNSQVVADVSEGNTVLYNTSLTTASGNGISFRCSLNLSIRSENVWGGMAVNYKNSNNFYYFRCKGGANSYAFARMEEGAHVQMANLTLATGIFETNKFYTLTVTSSDPYQFTYEIKETVSGTVVVTGSVTDPDETFAGGYAGLLASTTGPDKHRWDNFSLTQDVESDCGFNLMVPSSMVPDLQSRILSSTFAGKWSDFLERADRLCDINSSEYADPDNVTEGYDLKVHIVPRRLIYWMQTLGLAYRLTEDVKYRDHGIDLLLNSAKVVTVDSVYMEEAQSKEGALGDMMRGLATGYDFFAADMTGLDREQVLLTAGEYLNDIIPKARDPLTSWIPYHNYLGVCAGAAGLVAMQLRDMDVASSEQALQEAIDALEVWLAEGVDDQGANYEGMVYFVYGLENVILFADVLKRNGGEDLFLNPSLRKVPDYLIQSVIPGTKTIDARNDSLYWNPGEILLKLASEYNSGPTRWLYQTRLPVSNYTTWSPGCSFFLQLLWTDATASVALADAGLPLDECFRERGLCTWRNGWEDNSDIMFSIEAGKYHLVTHNQADKGHFTLYGYGYRWACDPGYANNNDLGGRAQTEAHNCILIDSVGQARSGAGIGTTGRVVAYKSTPEYGYSFVDCSDAYRYYHRFDADTRLENPDGLTIEHMTLDHAYRQTLFVRAANEAPAYAVILDNIQKDESAHEYRWQMLSWPDLDVAVNGTTASVSPTNSSVSEAMSVFFDAESSVTTAAGTYVPDDGKTPTSFPLLKATCTAVNPYFATVLVPSDAGEVPTVTFSNSPTEKIISVAWSNRTDRIYWDKTAVSFPDFLADNFNRASSGMNSSGITVAPDWFSSRTTGQWGITNRQVVANMVEGNSVLYNDSFETSSGSGTGFTVNLDVTALTENSWAGVVFNYQDAGNFYFLRYKSDAANYVLARMNNGTIENLISSTLDSGVFSTDIGYTLTVSSEEAGHFSYRIKEPAGAVLVEGTVADGSASPLTGGYAGLLQSSLGPNRHSFNNFSIETGSTPSITLEQVSTASQTGLMFILL